MEEWPLTCWQGCFSPGYKYSDAGEESWHNIVSGMAVIWLPLCNTMPGNMPEKFIVFLVSLFPGFYQIFFIGLRGNSLIVHLLYLWQSLGNTSWPKACCLLHYCVGHCKGLAALVNFSEYTLLHYYFAIILCQMKDTDRREDTGHCSRCRGLKLQLEERERVE